MRATVPWAATCFGSCVWGVRMMLFLLLGSIETCWDIVRWDVLRDIVRWDVLRGIETILDIWDKLRISPWRCDLHVEVCYGDLHGGPGTCQPLQLARARGLFAHVEADPSSDGLKLDALLTCFRMFWIWMDLDEWKGQRWRLSSWALGPCVLGWVCWRPWWLQMLFTGPGLTSQASQAIASKSRTIDQRHLEHCRTMSV